MGGILVVIICCGDAGNSWLLLLPPPPPPPPPLRFSRLSRSRLSPRSERGPAASGEFVWEATWDMRPPAGGNVTEPPCVLEEWLPSGVVDFGFGGEGPPLCAWLLGCIPDFWLLLFSDSIIFRLALDLSSLTFFTSWDKKKKNQQEREFCLQYFLKILYSTKKRKTI